MATQTRALPTLEEYNEVCDLVYGGFNEAEALVQRLKDFERAVGAVRPGVAEVGGLFMFVQQIELHASQFQRFADEARGVLVGIECEAWPS